MGIRLDEMGFSQEKIDKIHAAKQALFLAAFDLSAKARARERVELAWHGYGGGTASSLDVERAEKDVHEACRTLVAAEKALDAAREES